MANVLLGVTGSVAAVKTPELVSALIQAGHAVKVLVTEPALYFFRPSELPAGILFREDDEWPVGGYHRGDAVLHIELRKWADVFVIAPLDANTLAKLAYGLADNCLTCVARAWDLTRPMILAPAMNTLMWQHPATTRHCRQLVEDRGRSPSQSMDADGIGSWINHQKCGLQIVLPVTKELACGDVGPGGMAEVAAICAAIPR
jgi:phosphopantothenoylcysteine decarboxylase